MNILPVRLAPCAAGARPSTSTRGASVAEPGERPAPVGLILERGPLVQRHLLTPVHEARAAPAGRDLALELVQRAHDLSERP